jgi:hydrolase, TatD family
LMNFFDTHAHYEDPWFDADRQELISCLPASGVQLVMNCGSDGTTSEKSVALAQQYDFFYAAVGWHPHEAKSWDEHCGQKIRLWAQNPKVRAIGETGLDYHYDLEWKQLQREVFEAQLCLAEELDLPVVIHDREAHGDTMNIIRRYPNVRGEFHCYSGSAEMARELLDRGWYLGFNGAITLPGARRSLETIAMMPLERILLETDCPYLAPMPRTEGRRNDSRRLTRVAEVIAEVRDTTPDQIAEFSLQNGRRFFGL